MKDVGVIPIHLYWDISDFTSVAVGSRGKSGGLLSIWNSSLFYNVEVIKCHSFILVSGNWCGISVKMNFINVYAPDDIDERSQLWSDLLRMKRSGHGIWLVMGDYNEVREKGDIFSEIVCVSSMNAFNDFIMEVELSNFFMGGRRFTWMSPDGKSLSKIDRFLACNGFLAWWSMASVMALPRLHSDHSLVILVSEFLDYGPIPFRFFNSWLQLEVLGDIVQMSWNVSIEESRADKLVLLKLKRLKDDIKCWRVSLRIKKNKQYWNLLKCIEYIEIQAEKRCHSSPERMDRKNWKNKVLEMETIRTLDLMMDVNCIHQKYSIRI